MNNGVAVRRRGRRLVRGVIRKIVRGAAVPFRYLPESPAKEAIKVALLKIDNNLPYALHVNAGETAIQVGTPNPRTMIEYSRAVGARGRVIIIEAEPDNVERLRRAFPALPYRNVTIVAKGAWSAKGRLPLLLSPHSGDHKFAVPGISHDNDYRPENTYERSIDVQVDTLDSIVRAEGLARVDFVSITVNGAEMEVLKGADEVLARRGLRLWVKGHPRQADGRPINEAIIALLSARGFTAHRTAGEPAVGAHPRWRVREGDVYAFKF
jgi:FkbM family methyltransferase